MNYRVSVTDPHATPAQRQAAALRFGQALEASLGDAALVAAVYLAYQRIAARYGHDADPTALSDAERTVWEQWQAAEHAAMVAAFGPLRYLDDAQYSLHIGD